MKGMFFVVNQFRCVNTLHIFPTQKPICASQCVCSLVRRIFLSASQMFAKFVRLQANVRAIGIYAGILQMLIYFFIFFIRHDDKRITKHLQ